MAHRACKECGHRISALASTCPKCLAATTSALRRALFVTMAVGVLCVAAYVITDSRSELRHAAAKKAARSVNITWSKYEQIQNGMSFEQVMQIIGGPPHEKLSAISPSSRGGLPRTTAFWYRMDGRDGSVCIRVDLQGDTVVGKQENGLK